MKRMTVIIAILFLFCGTSWSDSTWTEGEPGCYEYLILGDEPTTRFMVNTSVQLTNEKGSIATNSAEVKKQCNDIGQSLYGRLLKIPEVSGVVIADRQVGINKYRYPPAKWDEKTDNNPMSLKKRVMIEFKAVLCK